MRIIDIHAHVFPENIVRKVIDTLQDFYGFKWQGLGTLPDYLRCMDEAGIARSVIFSAATKPEQVRSINDYIAGQVSQYPDKLAGFGTLHPDYEMPEEELERISDLGLKGIKIHPDFQQLQIDSPEMIKLFRKIGKKMPVLIHAGDGRFQFSNPDRIARLHRTVPELQIIAAHMGGWSEWEMAWKYLIGKEEVYLDISSTIGHVPAEQVRDMVRTHGADKVLFASDYPAVTPKQTIQDVLSLNLSSAEYEMIFYKNAERLLGL